MKKLFKAFCLATVLVLAFSFSAFAAAVDLDAPQVNKTERTAIVSGEVSNPAATNQQVTIVVLKSTASLSSMTDSDIVYLDQVAVQADNTFSFSFAVDQAKGDSFNAYVGGTQVTTVDSVVINFGTAKKGDLNGDGFVDIEDYNLIVNNFNKATFDPRADATGDGFVDIEDYNIVINAFNT